MSRDLQRTALRCPLWLLCALVVAVEGVVVLVVLGQAAAPPLGGDATWYGTLAHNRATGHVGTAGRLVAGAATGRLAALACATYLPLVWLTTWQMAEVAAGCGIALAMLAALMATRRHGPALGLWALSALALAASSYMRPSFLLLAAPMGVAILLSSRASWRARARWAPAVAFAAAVTLAVAPWAARNYALTGDVMPLAVASGGSLYASAQQYDGTLGTSFGTRDWARFKRTSREISRPFRDRGLRPRDQVAFERRFGALAPWDRVSAADVARRLPARLGALWGPADTTPGEGLWSDPLRRLGLAQYALLAALTLVGLVTRRRRLVAEWPLWLPAAYLTLLHLVFHVETRYTVPARPLLVVYAAAGAVAAAQVLARSRSRSRSRTPGRPARQRWWLPGDAVSPRR